MTDEFGKARDDLACIGVVHAGVVAGSKLADGEERADAVDVGKETAFVGFLCSEFHRGVALHQPVEAVPCLLLARHAQTQHNHAFIVLFFQDQRRHRIAHVQLLERIERVAQLPARDDARGHTADIDQQLILAAEHDGALQKLTRLGAKHLGGILEQFIHHGILLSRFRFRLRCHKKDEVQMEKIRGSASLHEQRGSGRV